MSEAEALLSTLRDIQEPIAPEGVSLWLLVANLIALVLLICALLTRRIRRKEGWRIEAKQQIALARQMKPEDGVVHLARLLRQLLLHRQEKIVNLDGHAWLMILNEHFSTDWFSTHEGCIFGHALYQPNTLQPAEFQLLCDKVSQLITTLPASNHATHTP